MVEPVDVLRDECVELPLPLQGGEGVVTGVRLGVVHGAVGAIGPGTDPVVAVGDVVLDGGGALGGGVLRPDAVGATEIGDPGLGRDAGAGQDGDRPGLPQPRGDGINVGLAHGASLPESGASGHRTVR